MKWFQYLLCLIVILSGIYCGIETVKMVTAKSDTVGSYVYVKESPKPLFSTKMSEISLSKKDNSYTWSKTYDAVKFDGKNNKYEFTLNDRPAYAVTTTAGTANCEFVLSFKDTNANVIQRVSLFIDLKFFENYTTLDVSLTGDMAYSLMSDYIACNGLSLAVTEV